MDNPPTFTIYIQIERGEITSPPLVDNISLTTHGAEYDILNEFFKEAAIGSGPVSDVESLGKLSVFTAESTHRSEVLGHTVRL